MADMYSNRSYRSSGRNNTYTGRSSMYSDNRYSHQTYISGNTVRKESAVPVERPEYVPEVKRRKSQQPVEMPLISGLNFAFVMLLAIGVIGSSCLYIQKQSNIRSMRNEISSLQYENQEIKRSQTEELRQINASVDLSYVYEVATGQLGMVDASNNKVYKYKDVKSNMVKQYAEIPSK